MGGNIETGMMEMLNDEERRAMFSEHFHKTLDKDVLTSPKEKERRHDEGPPIFKLDEVIEVRGGRFRVARIGKRGLLLRPVKG